MTRLLPRSLLGQMLLSVGLVLLVAQGISAFLQYREAERRREMGALNGLVFQLVAEPKFDFRRADTNAPNHDGRRRWHRLRVERTPDQPLRAHEQRQPQREEQLRAILIEQGIEPAELVMTTRVWGDDPYVMGRLQERYEPGQLPPWTRDDMLLAGLKRAGETEWTVARVPLSDREPRAVGSLIAQTLLLYLMLVGGLAWLLRRITRPIAALTRRVEHFAATREIEGQLEPSGPDDTQRLIAAHNAMEERIVALIDEKDVMLGAIGHDLKTPLAALRVRIEGVEDPTERAKMAASIEDITRSLDDILSLARVGRPTDPLEKTELSALVAAVADEYEDMGEPVELGSTERMAFPLRCTWLRRAVRNLIENAVRYGHRARVSLVREGAEAVIRVEDDGPGIPPGDIAGLMEPFARGEASRSRVTGGAGLGLTLARATAEQHGGTILLRNRPDAPGLIAEIRLPIPQR
jgi:signal transduction histidine kinase